MTRYLCELTGVSRSGYYAWVKNAEKHAIRDECDYEDYLLVRCVYDSFKGKLGNRNKNEKSLVSPLNKLTKRIWFVSFAVGTVGMMLRYKYPFTEIFWVISISTLILAFTCISIILIKDIKFAERLDCYDCLVNS